MHGIIRLLSCGRTPKKKKRHSGIWKDSEEDRIKCFQPLHSDTVSSLSPMYSDSLLSGGADGNVCFTNVNNGSAVAKWQHEFDVTRVTSFHNETRRLIFSGSRDSSIKGWKIGGDSVQQQFNGHQMSITGLDVNHDGSVLCSGSRDCFLNLFDIVTNHCISSQQISRNVITYLKCSAISSLMVQTSEDRMVKIWCTKQSRIALTSKLQSVFQNCCDISHDDRFVLTCDNNSGSSQATLWDLRSFSSPLKTLVTYDGHYERIHSCIFLKKSRTAEVATASADGIVKVWDLSSGLCNSSINLSVSAPIYALAETGRGLAVGCHDEVVYLLERTQHNQELFIGAKFG